MEEHAIETLHEILDEYVQEQIDMLLELQESMETDVAWKTGIGVYPLKKEASAIHWLLPVQRTSVQSFLSTGLQMS